MLMSHLPVARNTDHRIVVFNFTAQYFMHKIGMTVKAIVIHYFTIVLTNENRLVKVLKCEFLGMLKSILRLGEPFERKIELLS